MTNSAKRGTLSSTLLSAAKRFSAADDDGADGLARSCEAGPEQPPTGTPSGEVLDDEIARKIAEELQSTAGILFNKGAASAEAFKPSYWSYEQMESPPSPAETASSETPSANAIATELAIPAETGVRQTGASRHLWLAAAACSCLALVLPAVIFMLSLSRPTDDGPAISPPTTVTEEQPQDQPQAPSRDTASLIARGDTFLGTGDIASARLYYQQAADAGNARAAMFLGLTFDPSFLDRAGTRGLHGDITQAATWYRRARDLGEPEAVRLLAGLNTK